MTLFKKAITRTLVSMLLIWGIGHSVQLTSASIKIINGTNKSLAFALVRTKVGSKYKKLYVSLDQKEPKKTDQNAWALFKENLTTAFANVKQTINVRFLVPNVTDAIKMNNFPQKIREYDRVLWIVELSNLASLVTALNAGEINPINNKIVPLEIGSALTAEIIEKNGKFAINTTGKLSEGAKALFNAITGSQEEAYEEQEGEPLTHLSATKIKKIQKELQNKQKQKQRQQKTQAIVKKYRP